MCRNSYRRSKDKPVWERNSSVNPAQHSARSILLVLFLWTRFCTNSYPKYLKKNESPIHRGSFVSSGNDGACDHARVPRREYTGTWRGDQSSDYDRRDSQRRRHCFLPTVGCATRTYKTTHRCVRLIVSILSSFLSRRTGEQSDVVTDLLAVRQSRWLLRDHRCRRSHRLCACSRRCREGTGVLWCLRLGRGRACFVFAFQKL